MTFDTSSEVATLEPRDISWYCVDLRDDKDAPFMSRSVIMHTVTDRLGGVLWYSRHSLTEDLDAYIKTIACRRFK